MALSLTLDVNDLTAQADFWSAALRYDVLHTSPAFVLLGPAAGSSGPKLVLQPVPEPKTVKNRMHVDWDVADRATEVARLVALGASVAGEGSNEFCAWTTLRDPEGNELCIEEVHT